MLCMTPGDLNRIHIRCATTSPGVCMGWLRLRGSERSRSTAQCPADADGQQQGHRVGQQADGLRLVTRANIMAPNRLLAEQLIAGHAAPPSELVLDVDASGIPLHGDQEQRECHAYYDHYCYLPLYV